MTLHFLYCYQLAMYQVSCFYHKMHDSSKNYYISAHSKLHDVEDTGQQHFVVKKKLQINYFHVNASPPEPLAVATSTFAAV